MKCVLHIGMDKTGTTTLQRLLAEQRQALMLQGVLYPKALAFLGHNAGFVRDGMRHVAFKYLLGDPVQQDVFLKRIGLADDQQFEHWCRQQTRAFDEECSQASAVHTVIISDEDIFRHTSETLVHDILDFLHERFTTVSVVIYVRGVTSYLHSAHSQHVRMGGCESAESFAKIFLEQGGISGRLAVWQRALTAEELSLKRYPVAHSQAVETDFLADVGITNLQTTGKAANRSVSATGLAVLLFMNRVGSRYFGRRPPAWLRRAVGFLMAGQKAAHWVDADAQLQQLVEREQALVDDFFAQSR